MKKTWAACAAFLALVLLCSCGLPVRPATGPESLASSSAALASSSQPQVESGSRSFTSIAEVKRVPQLAQLDFDVALTCRVEKSFPLLNNIARRGLRYPLAGSVTKRGNGGEGPSTLLDYAWNIYALYHDTVAFKNEYDQFTVPPERIVEVAADALADHGLAEKAPLMFTSRLYDNDGTGGSYHVYSASEEHSIFSSVKRPDFDLAWEEAGNNCTVRMTDREYVGVVLYHDYNYEKGADGRWRLVGGASYCNERGAPYMPYAGGYSWGGGTPLDFEVEKTLLPDVEIAENIIGSIGNSALSLGYWDRELTVMALDLEDFSVKQSITLNGEVQSWRLRDDAIMLLFSDRAVILDDELHITGTLDLPAEIAALRDNVGGVGPNRRVFGGYDATWDFSKLAYSTQQGLFLYDVAGRTSTQLFVGYTGDWFTGPGDGDVIFTLWSPRFDTNDGMVYGRESIYEEHGSYYGYNTRTYEETVISEADDAFIVNPARSGCGNYFSWLYRWGDAIPYLGQNHYVLGTEAGLLCGPLSGGSFSQGKVVAPVSADITMFTMPDGSWQISDFSAILADGRVIIASGYFHAPQYYCTRPPA